MSEPPAPAATAPSPPQGVRLRYRLVDSGVVVPWQGQEFFFRHNQPVEVPAELAAALTRRRCPRCGCTEQKPMPADAIVADPSRPLVCCKECDEPEHTGWDEPRFEVVA